MGEFTYTDIFDTKGIEYLIIIAFLMLLIPLWIWMSKPITAGKKAMAEKRTFSLRNIFIPEGLFLSKYHTWAFLGKSGLAKIGVDDLLLHLTGSVRLQVLKPEGKEVKQGEAIARLIKNGKKLEVVSPVSGEITDVNRAVLTDQGSVNSGPYDEGWICRIKPSRWQEETRSCYLGNTAVQWLRQEVDKMKEFLLNSARETSGSGQPVLQEGGELSGDSLAGLPYEVWEEFERKFLKS